MFRNRDYNYITSRTIKQVVKKICYQLLFYYKTELIKKIINKITLR